MSAENERSFGIVYEPSGLPGIEDGKLIEDWKDENPDQTVSDQAIAADIARVIAVATAFPGANQRECECDTLSWLEQRPPVMNA